MVSQYCISKKLKAGERFTKDDVAEEFGRTLKQNNPETNMDDLNEYSFIRALNYRNKEDLTKAEKYFLTRLVFEHVDSADYAELISRDFGDRGLLDLSIRIKDSSNKPFTIRPAFHPKEVALFHRLLIESKLDVQFEPSHKFLLIFNEKNILVGGVFWKKTSKNISHLEKIVIIPDYQGRYLSIKLIEELYQRLKIKKFKYVTVGFFKSELFYKLGFEINQKFGGLVKRL